MSKWILSIFALISFNVFAAPSGGTDSTGVKNTCEISGGTFTGSESGNWACCWSNWGCYGCHSGNCGMTCRTQKCRDANAAKVNGSSSGVKIKGLAPANMNAPYVPYLQKKSNE